MSKKQLVWKAHNGMVLCLDWSATNNQILSGAEDRTYRLWLPSGHNLYISRQFPFPITSVAWSPKGDIFCVGSYNSIVLCDKCGWEKNLVHMDGDSGSIGHIRFSPNGQRIACAGFRNSVVIVQIVAKEIRYRNFVASVANDEQKNVLSPSKPFASTKILLRDINTEATEYLDLAVHNHDPNSSLLLQHLEMNSHHVIAVVQSQIFSFEMPFLNTNNNPPHVIPFPSAQATVSLVLLVDKYFIAIVSNSAQGGGSGGANSNVASVYTYDGKNVSNINISAYFTSANNINKKVITANNAVLALVDTDGRGIRVFSLQNGKQIGETIHIDSGVAEVALSQSNMANVLLAIVDKSHSLELMNVRSRDKIKIATVVESIAWHDTTDMLCVLLDNQLSVFAYPFGVFVDRNAADKIKVNIPLSAAPIASAASVGTFTGSSSSSSSAPLAGGGSAGGSSGEGTTIECFYDNSISYRRSADGVLLWAAMRPYYKLLNELIIPTTSTPASTSSGAGTGGRYFEGTRLCRYVNDPVLWNCFALMCVENNELNSAESAYAALEEVDKVKFLLHVKGIPQKEGQNAEMLLFKRKVVEAEKLYISAGLYKRAIKMNTRLFRWEHALEIAKNISPETASQSKNGSDLEYAVGLRRKYLEMCGGKEETLPCYLEYKDLQVNLDDIKKKIKEDIVHERKNQKKQKMAAKSAAQKKKGSAAPSEGGDDDDGEEEEE